MKAVAVIPGQPNSIHLREVQEPTVSDVPGGRGVLVRVLRVGVDGTDKEINAAEYGKAPEGDGFLIVGHETFGVVEQTGPNVTELAPGDFVVPTVRRPGRSIYDLIGTYDMTTEDDYFERGINLRHGFLTEYIVDAPEYIVKVPKGLREAAVLLEPTSIVEKGIAQAYEIQRRLKVWQPKRAAVFGAGTIGLLATLVLRIKGIETHSFARTKPPFLNSTLIEGVGAHYISTQELSIAEATKQHGPFDLIFEATGNSQLVFEGMQALAKNGVLVVSSVTAGKKQLSIPADEIVLSFVLGNKVMVGTVNANRGYFESGVKDLAYASLQWPGWLEQILTHRVSGLANYKELMRLLTDEKSAIKVFLEVNEG